MAKILCVTGNSGKRVFSWFLASRLAAGEEKAALLDTESGVPTAQLLVPTNEKADPKSLGRILSAAIIDPKGILQNMVTFDQNKNLGLLSYAPGESKEAYPELSAGDLESFFGCLGDLVDTIVVRTERIPNAIDRYALTHGSVNLCVTTADVKGVAYRQRYPYPDAVHLLYANSPYNPIEDIRHTYPHQVKYTIPFCKSLQPLYNGVLLPEVSPPKPYAKLLDKLIQEVRSWNE